MDYSKIILIIFVLHVLLNALPAPMKLYVKAVLKDSLSVIIHV